MLKATLLCLIASPALADGPVCMPREELIAKLDEDYSERNMARGMETRGGIVEVYVSPKGTWTMAVIPPTEGVLQACPIAAGTDWKMIIPGIDG